MAELEVIVFELPTEDGHTIPAILTRDVTYLNHEVGNNAMNWGASVVVGAQVLTVGGLKRPLEPIL